MSNIYSPSKASKHPDRLKILQEGGQPNPVHVQLVISDLCNENCSFCLVSGTMVSTPKGDTPIENLRVGDLVYGPDGVVVPITQTGSRYVNEIIRVRVGSHYIQLTEEHPILTTKGFKEAGKVSIGDTAVVRLRLRESGKEPSEILESISERSSAKRKDIRGSTRPHVGSNEEQQSYEGSSHSGESRCKNKGKATSQKSGRHSKYSSSSPKAYVVGPESDERSSEAPGRHGEDTSSPGYVQKRGTLQNVGSRARNSVNTHRFGRIVDWKKKSGFSSTRAEKSNRGNAKRDLYWKTEEANSSWLWSKKRPALRGQGLEMPGRFQGRSSIRFTGRIARSSKELCVAGIQLERGLGLHKVDSIEKIQGRVEVFNIHCPPIEAFEASGIVVHNCAYRLDGYSSNQLFKVIQPNGQINNNPNRMISFEKVKEIVDDCAAMNVKAIQLTGGGEPTVHPQFGEICRYIHAKGIPFSVVTNGVLLGRYLEECALATWVRVSIDAGLAETYSKVREVKPTTFDKVWDNVRKFAAVKGNVALGIGFVVTLDNYKEISLATHLARDSGADNIRVSAFFQNEGQAYYKDVIEDCRSQIKDAEWVAAERSDFQLFNIFEDRVDDLHGRPDYEKCGYMHFTTYIGGDQNVYTCCVLAYNEQGMIGSIKDKRFAEVWASHQKQQMFATFDARGCERCMFNNKNRSIADLITVGPHDNFV